MTSHEADDSGAAAVPAADASGDGVSDVVRVALAVPGVHAVRVEPATAEGGGSMVRLELAEGADEAQVARAVDEALRSLRPPAPRTSEESVPASAAEGSLALPAPAPPVDAEPADEDLGPAAGPAPAAPAATAQGRAARPRTGRMSVPSLASPTVAATPAPSWLGEAAEAAEADPDGRDAPAPERSAATLVVPTAAPAGAPAPGAGPEAAAARLVLDRVDVATEALATRASVVLRRGAAAHTGVAEAAATSSGGRRAVATAAVRALESVLGGAVRVEVEAVSVAAVGGAQTALVLLDAATRRGPEQLVGAALVRRGEDDAVVRAVLDAANRRSGLDLR